MAQRKNFIKKIFVEDLFGYYTYTIPSTSQNVSSFIIIYGDNGSGKTTLLDLLFHLLATEDNAGHKSSIGRIKFKQFGVTLENNVEILASRTEASLGTYDLVVRINSKDYLRVTLKYSLEDEAVKIKNQSENDQKNFNEILRYIDSLGISIYLLNDKRDVTNSRYNNGPENIITRTEVSGKRIYFGADTKKEKLENVELAVKGLEAWIRKQVFTGARKGEQDNNAIYTDIVKRIHKSKVTASDLKKKTDILIANLEEIRIRSINYYKYGLISKVETKEIENILENSKSQKAQVIYNVIEPFAEGLKARLDSLQNIHDFIYSFLKSINSYFTNKKIDYSMANGLLVKYEKTNEEIDLKFLSSGERQLILLLCHIITTSEQATIFIIDEPEISLNVQWQRKLGDTLLEFSKGKNMQFILATHSIELLTNHNTSVSRLTNEKK
jgi:energy-coupling factor transporter ATP-binding protein EcfA2